MRATKQTILRVVVVMCSVAAFSVPAPAQTDSRIDQNREGVPVLRVSVVDRTTPTINYRHRGGATKIDFVGTSLLPDARGEAKVESKKGYIEIEVEFDKLQPASNFGPEYLTYVLWAITPEGRAINLGEILLDSQMRGKLNVTTELQAFGQVVTAEPYSAVTQPSNVVVMENIVRPDTQGKVDQVNANYELLERGQYTRNVEPSRIHTAMTDPKTPIELLEARNAVQIARWAGADEYAGETFQKSEELLQQAEDYHSRNSGRKSVAMVAREAAQTAEDSRLIAVKRQNEEQLAAERRAADEEAQRRQEAEADRVAAERATQQAEADRIAAERATQQAEAAKEEALIQQQAVQEEAQRANRAAREADRMRLQAEREKSELRAQLREQLNTILDTRDTARGLIVNMSDVLFDTGKYNLRPAAREKLSKIAGILLSHRLGLEVEGHADSQGSEDYNQRLSEERADAVKRYLAQQGIPSESIAAKGFGETHPVVSNATAAGRQQNRRVELIVSGEAIGSGRLSEWQSRLH